MNIFHLEKNLKKSAQYHCDKHVVKMILEYAQLLSTTHRILDKGKVLISEELYKATHVNHPCSIWTRKTSTNYSYVFILWFHLMKEYTFRYGKIHKTSRLLPFLKHQPKNILKSKELTEIPLAMPDKYKVKDDPIISYRNYYIGDKVFFAKWTKREIPKWFIKGE